jgi:hypothetical protein
MAIWNNRQPFGISLGHLVPTFWGHLVYFSRFGMLYQTHLATLIVKTLHKSLKNVLSSWNVFSFRGWGRFLPYIPIRIECLYPDFQFYTQVCYFIPRFAISYPGLLFNSHVCYFIPRFAISYPGLLFHTKVSSCLPWFAVSYFGVQSNTQVYSFLPRYAVSLLGMKFNSLVHKTFTRDLLIRACLREIDLELNCVQFEVHFHVMAHICI